MVHGVVYSAVLFACKRTERNEEILRAELTSSWCCCWTARTLTRRLMLRYSDRGSVTHRADAVMMNSRFAMIVYLAHAARIDIHTLCPHSQYSHALIA